MKEKITQEELELLAKKLINSWERQGLNTELSMLCTHCGNDIDLVGFLVHSAMSACKSICILLGEDLLIKMLKKAMKSAFSKLAPTRGIIDTSMAQLANDFGMECPKCKQTPFWKQVSAFYKAPEQEALISK